MSEKPLWDRLPPAGRRAILGTFAVCLFLLALFQSDWGANIRATYWFWRAQTYDSSSVAKANRAFEIAPSLATAWQTASRGLRKDIAPSKTIQDFLMLAPKWEFTVLSQVDLSPATITAKVDGLPAKFVGWSLGQLNTEAKRIEREFVHYSYKWVRDAEVVELEKQWAALYPLAKLTWGDLLVHGVADFIGRQVNGILEIFSDPGSVETLGLVSKFARRSLGFIDAVQAINETTDLRRKVELAKTEQDRLITRIVYFRDGALLSDLERSRDSARKKVVEDIKSTLRYKSYFEIGFGSVLKAFFGWELDKAFIREQFASGYFLDSNTLP